MESNKEQLGDPAAPPLAQVNGVDGASGSSESLSSEEGPHTSATQDPAAADSDDAFSDSDVSATEIVYARDGVSVRPTATTRIDGRLSLVKQGRMLFIAWLPYRTSALPPGASGALSQGGAPGMSTSDRALLYAVHPIPLSDVRAIRRHVPLWGRHTIEVTLRNGITLPPFYLHQGGAKSFTSVLRENANLVRSEDDPSVFLVNDLADPLQRTLTSLHLAEVLPAPDGSGAGGILGEAEEDEAAGGGGRRDVVPIRSQLHDMVDRFQRFTAGARDAASSFLTGSVMLSQLDTVGRAVIASAGVDPASLDGPYDDAAEGAEGEREGQGSRRSKGPFADTAQEAAAHAEGAPPGSGNETAGRALSPPSLAPAGWELVERSASGDMMSPSWARARPPPLTPQELETMYDGEGRLAGEAALRQRAFYGGIEPEARPEAWKFLLGVHSAGVTLAEREEAADQRLKRYITLRRQWKTIGADQEGRNSKWRERKGRVDKDVRRTDRRHKFFAKESAPAHAMLRNVLLTHVMWNFDLGYCQGMSDLAAPLLFVARTAVPGRELTAQQQAEVESEAFWCFAALMQRMEGNFSSDCTGMHAQLEALRQLLALLDPPLHAHLARQDALNLFFCYRWVLIQFKREFKFDQVLRLWEALWARPKDHVHLYLAVAILARQRRHILEGDLDFDGLLKLCVDLAGQVDLEQALADAEALREFAGEAGRQVVAALP